MVGVRKRKSREARSPTAAERKHRKRPSFCPIPFNSKSIMSQAAWRSHFTWVTSPLSLSLLDPTEPWLSPFSSLWPFLPLSSSTRLFPLLLLGLISHHNSSLAIQFQQVHSNLCPSHSSSSKRRGTSKIHKERWIEFEIPRMETRGCWWTGEWSETSRLWVFLIEKSHKECGEMRERPSDGGDEGLRLDGRR